MVQSIPQQFEGKQINFRAKNINSAKKLQDRKKFAPLNILKDAPKQQQPSKSELPKQFNKITEILNGAKVAPKFPPKIPVKNFQISEEEESRGKNNQENQSDYFADKIENWPKKSDMYLVRSDGNSCTREFVRGSGKLTFAYPSANQHLLVWRQRPKTVLIIKKLGSQLIEEFKQVVKFLGEEKDMNVIVEPADYELLQNMKKNSQNINYNNENSDYFVDKSDFHLSESNNFFARQKTIKLTNNLIDENNMKNTKIVSSINNINNENYTNNVHNTNIVQNSTNNINNENYTNNIHNTNIVQNNINNVNNINNANTVHNANNVHNASIVQNSIKNINNINNINNVNNANNVQNSSTHNYLHTYRETETDMLADIVDFVVCLGGDGVILHVSDLFKKTIPPIISFHLGSLGFLTNHEFKNFKHDLTNVLNGSHPLSDCTFDDSVQGVNVALRMRLQCDVLRDGKLVASHDVLNEVVIDRGQNSYLSNVEVFEGGKFITTVQGDGVMLATPTGSTAYSVAAGGSMVHPNVSSILFTPICPHSLSFKPVILPDYADIELRVPESARATAWVSFDGKHSRELQRGDSVRVRMSTKPVPTINQDNLTNDWFASLDRCFQWSNRELQKPLQ